MDLRKEILEGLLCPYCGSETKKVSETDVYGRDYRGRLVVICVGFPNCDSYVGTHEDGESLGRLASKDLRKFKILAHDSFDGLWKRAIKEGRNHGEARKAAYKWLSGVLGIDESVAHIGMMDEGMCERVIEVCKPYLVRNE